MKFILLSISIFYFNFLPFSKEIELISKVDKVTIYHSGALVKRLSNQSLEVGLNEVLIKNISSKIIMNSLKVNNKEVTVLNKELIRKLTKEEFNQLLDKKDALQKQINLIELKYAEEGFVKKVDELETMIQFYADRMLVLKKELREVNEKIDAAKKIENIDLDNDDAGILRLVVSVEKKLNQSFSFEYVCGGIGWSPSYDVTVNNSSDKKIEIKYLAKVMSQTGENWDNISISLSSSFPLEPPTTLPTAESSWTINNRGITSEPQKLVENEQNNQIQKLEGVNYIDISVPSYLEARVLKGLYSLKSNSTVFTFPINSYSLDANYYYYGFPRLDPQVYLVAEIANIESYGFVDGVGEITYNGNNIGKTIIKFSEAKDTLLLAVGKDNNVYMKRTEIVDKNYFKQNSSGKKKTITMAYRYELKNNNSFPVHFEMIDQVPISQTKSAEVEIEKLSNGNYNTETGEVTWVSDINPGKETEKELIYKIDMDNNYSYSYKKSEERFRTLSCPSF